MAYVLDSVEKSHKKEAKENTSDAQWEKLLKTANFGKLYAYAIEKVTPATEEEKEQVQGEWVKYDQGADHIPLCKSLQGHGTGWCTAGEAVARGQLNAGDFHVFYSKDKQGENKIPRVAIRMENGEIAEVRGINSDQNLESAMTDIAKEKTKTLPGGEKYEKKASDMKRLTEIEKKFAEIKIRKDRIEEALEYQYEPDLINSVDSEYWSGKESAPRLDTELEKIKLEYQKVELTKEELRFLYEIDAQIEGFGYQKDPRIFEICRQRDQKSDFMKIFDVNCQLEEFALFPIEICDDTKVICGDFPRKPDSRWGKEDAYIKLPKNLERIIGSAYFGGTAITSLGNLKIIEGTADFAGSRIKNLGQLEEIGGNVITSKKSKLDFSKVKIGGQIERFIYNPLRDI
ncbi:MAG: hypothetical protein NTV36_02890 [Candidatus Staskawiczbacteria bacterium]|nr:hypothetical protein [Candidatus Staskawiczbacteria bacterium]